MDKEEKKITVTVSSDNNKVIVKVMDNGSGIEADTLPYIFERFIVQSNRGILAQVEVDLV